LRRGVQRPRFDLIPGLFVQTQIPRHCTVRVRASRFITLAQR
jgi:hypothetical protein